jgi:hypothetical protein
MYDGDRMQLTGPFIDSPSFKLWCMARFDYRDLRLLDLFTNSWEIVKGGHGGPTADHPVERAINYSIYTPPTSQSWRDAWRITEGLIAAMRDECVHHGAMFLALTEDTGIQVWPLRTTRDKFQKRLGVSDLFYPDRRIAELGQRDGFEVLTLAQPLQRYAEEHHVFLHGFKTGPKGFGHWNETGHAVAGHLIAQKLCAMIAVGRCGSCGGRTEAGAKTVAH